jgi:ActR/RegA family two-component response regulator
MVSQQKPDSPKLALLVDPSLSVLSALQDSFTSRGVQCVASRDLLTALLAVTQHEFNFAIINARIKEEGDGWTLAGLARKLFPRAYVAVTCVEKDVLVLQSAINSGLNQVFESSTSSEEVVLTMMPRKSGTQPRVH